MVLPLFGINAINPSYTYKDIYPIVKSLSMLQNAVTKDVLVLPKEDGVRPILPRANV